MGLNSQNEARAAAVASPRRNALTAVASVVAAMALAAAVAGRSCRVDESSPAGVARAFAAAADADDREALYELFGPETRARLHAAAKRATDLAGGATRYGALDMISIGRATENGAPKDFVVKEDDGSRAVVEIIGANDERAQITLVQVDEQWRIELPAYGNSP